MAVGNDGAGKVEETGEIVAEAHVFEGGGIIFGGKEVITFGEAQAFADVFEGVGVGPANADGFFGEGEDLAFLGVERVLGLDPVDLIGEEETGEDGVGVDGGGGEDGGHIRCRVKDGLG